MSAVVLVIRSAEAAGAASVWRDEWPDLRRIDLQVEHGLRGGARALRRALALRRKVDCVVTVSPPISCVAIGDVLHRLGVPWIAYIEGSTRAEFRGRRWRLLHPYPRALQRANLVVTPSAAERERLHSLVRPSVATLTPDGLRPHVLSLTRAPAAPADRSLRILMLGTLNTPHVEHLAVAIRERGHDVLVAGDVTPAYPPSRLPTMGVPASVIPAPATLSLRRLLRQFKPDVVHAHWLYGFAFLAAVVRARPLVAMAWGSDVLGATGRELLKCRYALRQCDLAMTDSAALVDRLVKLGADPAHTEVVNWGVDLELFAPPRERAALRARLGLGEGPVVLSPRALTPIYNIDVILDAFERAARSLPGLQLILKHIGSGAPDLGRQLPDAVRIVGHVPYAEMAAWYGVADAVISIPSSDSSPRSVWEAMACGAPCVVSDLPWVRELIEPGRHALVVNPDADAVARAITTLLGDPEGARRMGREGRALVEHARNSEREMDRLSDIYRRVARRA